MQKFNRYCNLAANEHLNSMNESRSCVLRIPLRTTLEPERNIRYANETLEVNQIPNKHSPNKEIRSMLNTRNSAKNSKLAANY